MITPRISKNTTSTIKINGIFEVGLTQSMISHCVSSNLLFEITSSNDLGMIGDHCLITRLPFEYTAMVYCSMKLFDLPIPVCWQGSYNAWKPVAPGVPPSTMNLLSLKAVSTHLTLAPATVTPSRSSEIILDFKKKLSRSKLL